MLRSLDIVLSFFGIICALPVMLIIYILEIISGQSPLFLQERVGKDKHLFTLIKFRTMDSNTKSVGTHLVNPNSITKLGHYLRKFKMDELPQLFNVLIGQMSLVGPRPCLASQLTLLAEREKRVVFSIRPGITGLAQIRNIDMSTPRKLARIDHLMVMNMSIGIYFKIIFATLLGKGMGDKVRLK